jgi:pilus assembly protein CpaF
LRPCAIDGPNITIRKFAKERLTMDNLISFGSLTSSMADFLQACVVSRLNIIVSGGTGSGKTTLINCLSGYIPDGERTVTIEDAAELQFNSGTWSAWKPKNPRLTVLALLPSVTAWSIPCACGPNVLSSASAGVGKRWICCKP